jgi:UDP-GlcNAc:undecaprenyl-phosphate/decaprenyl-phosphate GlcNAc-1-phosphate transferase
VIFYGYFISFLLSLACSMALSRCVRKLAAAHAPGELPDPGRHLHGRPVPRFGGVAIVLSLSAVVTVGCLLPKALGLPARFPPRTEFGILLPALVVFLLGLRDDLRPLGPYVKLAVQSLAALLLYAAGFGVHQFDLLFGGHVLGAFVGLPLTVFWVLLITNAFNLIDGLDGLAAGSALFSTAVVFVVSLSIPNALVSFLSIALAGAILGFLPFNFHRATIFLGDSGSLFIGFLLSALGLAGFQKAPTMIAVAIPVVSFGLPILDVAIAVLRRFLRGKSLFRADREHIHHKLLERGLSQREAVLILYGVSAGFGLLSLALLHGAGLIAVVLAVIGSGVCIGVQHLRYHEFSELHRLAQRAMNQKQIIANNLSIRHTAELLRASEGFPQLCETLAEVFEPLGFDGYGFLLPFAAGLPESLLAPLSRNGDAELHYSVTPEPFAESSWKLSVELVSSSGEKCGSFSLYRRSVGSPLLLDINLLTSSFQTALADAVYRAIAQDHAKVQVCEPAAVAMSKAAGGY